MSVIDPEALEELKQQQKELILLETTGGVIEDE